METEIETQHRFGRSDRAGKIFADILRLEHGKIRGHQMERPPPAAVSRACARAARQKPASSSKDRRKRK